MSEANPDPEFRDDPEARVLAERLARADLSADSRVRASLRARLLAGGRAPDPASRIARPAAALAFAAALFVFVLPFALKDAPTATGFPRGPEGLPVLPGRLVATGMPEAPLIETRRTSIDELIVRRRF